MRATTNRSDPTIAFAKSVANGLQRHPRQMDCRFLYDARGSALYEQICEQPEYYPTRTEADILARYASEICEITGPVTLLELGSGSSCKTDFLLSAYRKTDPTTRYVPIDISESALLQASQAIGKRHPEVQVVGIHGTYQDALPLFSCASPAMVVFLGSTIGNMNKDQEARFWQWMSSHMKSGDYFLLGIDLVKEAQLLDAAYNDAAGVTEKFTKNFFVRMNRELGSGLDISSIEHVANYNDSNQQVEICARFKKAQKADIVPLNQSFTIEANEKILIEISRKFELDELDSYLTSFGFETLKVFTDDRQWFASLLLKKK